MPNYHFVRKINGTDETGIMDVESQTLLCLCTEENSKTILKALMVVDAIRSAGADIEKALTEWGIIGADKHATACAEVATEIMQKFDEWKLKKGYYLALNNRYLNFRTGDTNGISFTELITLFEDYLKTEQEKK